MATLNDLLNLQQLRRVVFIPELERFQRAFQMGFLAIAPTRDIAEKFSQFWSGSLTFSFELRFGRDALGRW